MASSATVTVAPPLRVPRDTDHPMPEEQLRLRINAHINTHFRDRGVCRHTNPDACTHSFPYASNEVMKQRIFRVMSTKCITQSNFSMEFGNATAESDPYPQLTLPPDRRIAGVYITPEIKRAMRITAVGLVAIVIVSFVLVAGYSLILQTIA